MTQDNPCGRLIYPNALNGPRCAMVAHHDGFCRTPSDEAEAVRQLVRATEKVCDFIRIRPADPQAGDPGCRLRVVREEMGNIDVYDEQVLPERVLRPDANRVTPLGHLTLTEDEAQWLCATLAEATCAGPVGVLRPLTAREVEAALHEGRAEAMAATGDNAWTTLLRQRDEARSALAKAEAERDEMRERLASMERAIAGHA